MRWPRTAALAVTLTCVLTGLATASSPADADFPQTRRIAVIFLNGKGQHHTSDPRTFVSSTSANPGPIASWFQEVSGGQVTIAETVFPHWYDTNINASKCYDNVWGDIDTAAQTAAAADGFRPQDFDHFIYMFYGPTNCHPGLGDIAGKRTWVMGPGTLDATIHDLGHNLGLVHASTYECGNDVSDSPGAVCTRNEYGDHMDVMGADSSVVHHFQGFNKWRIGWMADDKVVTVNANETRTIDLTASERVVPGATQLILVPLPDGTRYAIERRESYGTDAGFSGVWVRKIMAGDPNDVKSANNSLLLDMTPNSAWDDWSDANLAPGRWWTDTEHDITIQTLSDSGTTASVRVCRPACIAAPLPPTPAALDVRLDGTTMVVTGTAANDHIQIDKYNASTLRVWADRNEPVNAGPGCVLVPSAFRVDCTGAKRSTLNATANMGGGNDVVFGPDKGPKTVINLGDGDDLFYDSTATDVINGGPGDDTVSFAFRTDKGLKGTPGDGANDGKKSEKDNIGADVEHVILPAPQ